VSSGSEGTMLDRASGFARQNQTLDDELWSEEEHACFVQALQEQRGGINWHVTAQRIGTKSAQQVANLLAVHDCCPVCATPPASFHMRFQFSRANPPSPPLIAVPCHRLKEAGAWFFADPSSSKKRVGWQKSEPRSTGLCTRAQT
jgi:hypothetical protein